jgi:propionate permease
MQIIGILGIILSLGLLMYLAFRGFSVVAVAPLLALLAVVIGTISMGEDPHLMAHYTEVFMASLGKYVRNYFPIFLLGAIFGKMLEDSGSADSISGFITAKLGSHMAILSVVLSCSLLTYGGVSLFVVAFAIYPIGAKLFKEVDIPKRILPGAIALGAFTYTMTAVPGSPQIQNAIPMKYFGTDAFAAPILGIIATIVMFGLGMFWLSFRAKTAKQKGEGYGEHNEHFKINDEKKSLPPFAVALAPIIAVLVINYILSRVIYPNIDGGYLEGEPYKTTLKAVTGNWSLIIALFVGIIITVILNFKRFEDVVKTITIGTNGSFLAIFNTASETGYGNVIAGLSAFAIISAGIVSISSNPLIGTAVSSSVLAGVTGSASGGLSIALETMGKQFLEIAQTRGINPQVLHRVASIACGGMDTLPHNGAVITLLGITGMTHKESYADIGMCTVIIPLIAVTIIIIFASFGIV